MSEPGKWPGNRIDCSGPNLKMHDELCAILETMDYSEEVVMMVSVAFWGGMKAAQDALKAENEKLKAELEQAKAELEQAKAENDSRRTKLQMEFIRAMGRVKDESG